MSVISNIRQSVLTSTIVAKASVKRAIAVCDGDIASLSIQGGSLVVATGMSVFFHIKKTPKTRQIIPSLVNALGMILVDTAFQKVKEVCEADYRNSKDIWELRNGSREDFLEAYNYDRELWDMAFPNFQGYDEEDWAWGFGYDHHWSAGAMYDRMDEALIEGGWMDSWEDHPMGPLPEVFTNSEVVTDTWADIEQEVRDSWTSDRMMPIEDVFTKYDVWAMVTETLSEEVLNSYLPPTEMLKKVDWISIADQNPDFRVMAEMYNSEAVLAESGK